MKVKLIGCAAIAFGIFCYYEPAHCGTLSKLFKKDEKKVDEAKEAEEEEGEDEAEEEGEAAEEEEKKEASNADVASSKSAENQQPQIEADNGTSQSASEPAPAAPKAVTPPSAPEKPKKEIKGDPVVARVGRLKEFHRSDVLRIMKGLPAQLTGGISHDRLFQMCLDQLVSSYLMVEQAKKAGLEKTKEYIEALEATKSDLLARQFLMKEVMPKADNESVLKARYAKYVVDFKSVKETQIFHIMMSNEKDAQEVIAKLDKGEDFKKLAKEKSMAPSKEKGGEEGYVAISMLPAQIKDTLEKLGKNGYTKKALEAGGAWHIFKVGDVRDSTHQSYEQIKDSLKQVIVQEEIMKLVARLMKQFNVTKFNEDGSALTAEQQQAAAAPQPQQQPAAPQNARPQIVNQKVPAKRTNVN